MTVKRPKGILFDNDGVLISSEELHLMAWKEMLFRMGLPYENVVWNRYVGKPAPLIMAALLDEFKPGWNRADYDLEKLSVEKNDIYLEIAKTQLAPYPGVREGLEWLKSQGIRVAVVSNAKSRELHFAMDTLQLRPFMDVIISRDDSPFPKPHPAMYEKGAAELGLLPSECIAIDDSPTGLESALLAGCAAASITTNYPRDYLVHPVPGRSDLSPVWIGDSTSQFFEWLKALPV